MGVRCQMASRRVTVFGGSGFLGREIVKRLAAEGRPVRIAVRHPERAGFLERLGQAGQIECIQADVWDEPTVARAVEQSTAVINTVGHYVEKSKATFDQIHGQGALHVARQASNAGVERLIHISGLGADPASDSPYVRARGIGETLVKEAFENVTILRPSVIFGPEDSFFNTLAGLARRSPILPLFGTGNTRLQPVYVGDVAAACAAALANPSAIGQTYELGGPGIHTYKALLQLVLEHLGKTRALVPVPFFVWDTLAAVLAVLPNPPLTRDQVKLMRRDNIADASALSFKDLGIRPASAEDVLPTYRTDVQGGVIGTE